MEVAGREAGDRRQALQVQVLVQVAADMVDHPLDPAAVLEVARSLWAGFVMGKG